MATEYDAKTIVQLVQNLFSYPEGPLVLEWMEEVYDYHKFQAIVQSANVNAPLAMAYQAGKSDLIKELKYIVKVGLPEEQKPEETEEGIEYGY
jgi:hypothetical protein